MDQQEEAIAKNTNFPSLNHSAWLEIRLFYVRITPCVVDGVPDHLTLRHPHRQIGVSLEINGSSVPAATEAAPLTLRRNRVDKESAEVTYVSTHTVRVTGSVEFEVYENERLLFLCGSLERLEADWDNNGNAGWGIECHVASGSGLSAFLEPKTIEVYVAGCCSGVPVILNKTIQTSPRARARARGRSRRRLPTLDAIPEEQEMTMTMTSDIRHRNLPKTTGSDYIYDCGGKMERVHGFYSPAPGEDGQLSWFNAGVRVGVGIGLGMCLGIGIGVGLLMRSYHSTTTNFRRRFF